MAANQQETQSQQVNLENCAKEPVHIIGKSQAHGVILICHPENLTVEQCGKNTSCLLSIPYQQLLGQHLSSFLDQQEIGILKASLKENEQGIPQNIQVNGKNLILLSHLSGEHLIIDIEPLEEEQEKFLFQKQLTRILNQLEHRKTVRELCDSAAKLSSAIFGYDRVMIYRFDGEWNGEVLSEVKEKEMESWLNLRYPATDIPQQSRELFLKHKVRVITDVDYDPVPIEPEISPVTGQPVDISRSNLRAVSPIHIEYLKNMEVGASLTAAIIVKGKLWGLIACHHRTKKYSGHYQREMARFVAQMLSTEITLIESENFARRSKASEGIRRQLTTQMLQNSSIPVALITGEVKVTDLISSGGAAVYFNDEFYFCGKTPASEEVQDLLESFLKPQSKNLFFTRNLSEEYPKAKAYKELASGVMSLRISENKYILWFRPEVLQTVSWGGDPNNKAYYNKVKERISPRKSFQKWSEELTGRSHEWEDYELTVARSLRENVSHIVLAKQRKEINALNKKLVDANKELELFSYGLSHDLRAPIRGLEGYLEIIQEDFSEGMTEQGKLMLQKTAELAEKMNQLVDDILEYSRLSHSESLEKTEFPVGDLIDEILRFFNVKINYPRTKVKVAKDLPDMMGDRRMLFQLWANLLNNALKYSAEKENPEVVVGFEEKGGQVFYFVRDNGIGIRNQFLEKIFDTFSRVAGSSYKGSGIGLAIAKKIIEKHNGRIWAESSPGEGTTFFFTLAAAKRKETQNDYITVKSIAG